MRREASLVQCFFLSCLARDLFLNSVFFASIKLHFFYIAPNYIFAVAFNSHKFLLFVQLRLISHHKIYR